MKYKGRNGYKAVKALRKDAREISKRSRNEVPKDNNHSSLVINILGFIGAVVFWVWFLAVDII